MTELKEFKFVTPLVIEFKKLESDDATKYTTLYSNSRAETIINESDNDDVFESNDYIKDTKISRKRFGLDY